MTKELYKPNDPKWMSAIHKTVNKAGANPDQVLDILGDKKFIAMHKQAFLRGFIKAANAGTTLPIGAPTPTLPTNGNPMQPQVQPQIPASMQQFMQLMHEYRDPAPTAPKTIKPWYRQQ